MSKRVRRFVPSAIALAGLSFAAASAWGDHRHNYLEFDEFVPIIEINATDGDIGYHVLLDGEGWRVAKIFDSDRDRMFKGIGTDDLLEQGITELFMESAEPLCNPEDAEDGEEVVTLEEFIDRFEAGVYHARGRTLDGERLKASADFTHNIPAAPHVEVEIEIEVDADGEEELEVEISWETGDDLGRCAFAELVADGVIPHPADVEVVRWEVVVEPDEDQLDEINEAREAMGEDEIALGVFSVQLPADVDEVEIPEEWLEAYTEAGVTEFKFEVGAREESGNQTFTEDSFDVEDAE